MDMKIFVDTDSDVRLARRLKRDIADRGRELEGVLKQYNQFVKPAFDHWISPTMSSADIIVPRGSYIIKIIQLLWKESLNSNSHTIPPISTKQTITSHPKTLNKQPPLTSKHWTNNHLLPQNTEQTTTSYPKTLNKQSPLTSKHWTNNHL